MDEQPNTEPTPELTKPRKKSNITDEERKRRADRMRDMANARNALLKKQKAERLNVTVESLDRAVEKKPRVKKTPAPVPPAPAPEPTVTSTPTTPEPVIDKKSAVPNKKPARVLKARTLVIQESSDSEDYGDSETSDSEEDEPVIYIAKKPRASKQTSQSITKPKKSKSKVEPALPVEPQIRVKFF